MNLGIRSSVYKPSPESALERPETGIELAGFIGSIMPQKRLLAREGPVGVISAFARDSGCTSARASRKGYDGLIFHCWQDLFCAGMLGAVLCFALRITFAAFLCVSV